MGRDEHSSTTDRVKGRVKEAAGALSDDEAMKREGETDQSEAELEEKKKEEREAKQRKERE